MFLTKLIAITFYVTVTKTFAETHLKITKLECNPSPKYFVNHTCRLKPINRYKTLAQMETLIRHSLTNISVNLGLYVRNDANNYNPFLVNFTHNICKFLDKSHKQGLYMGLLMRVLSQFSNVNHTCPYTGPLIVKNLDLDLGRLPFSVPKYSYKFRFIFYEGYPFDYIGTVTYYVELLETKRKKTK